MTHDTAGTAISGAGGSRDDAVAVVAGEFGGRVASLVGAVTGPEWAPGAGRHEYFTDNAVRPMGGWRCSPARTRRASPMSCSSPGP
jgi:hypothetical protein